MFRVVCGILVGGVMAVGARADLASYVQKPDESYSWRRVDEPPAEGEDVSAEIYMVSQTWRGIVWKHQMMVVRPPGTEKATHGLLLITGGGWRDGLESKPMDKDARERKIILGIAAMARMPVAFVKHVPFQPMFDGKHEDQIISFTFDQFLKTGDEEWPLLLPMTKAAVRALDTFQAFARKTWKLELSEFVVTGGSKRGWTTYLTGAVDPRVKGIAPMVIDVLNMPAQMKHQKETYGGYSEEIEDYTRYDLQERWDSERGRRLLALVDPFSYRKKLTMPKLLVLGTNDRYWTLDALNLYWDDLEGEKYVLYVPNRGHDVNDMFRVIGTASAFASRVAGRLKFPRPTWDLKETDAGLRLVVRSDVKPSQVVAWTTTSPTKDFRNARWTEQTIEPTGDEYVHEMKRPAGGFGAAFGECKYTIDGHTFFLSTNVRIIQGTAASQPTSDAGGK